jgi:hypothetical protein
VTTPSRPKHLPDTLRCVLAFQRLRPPGRELLIHINRGGATRSVKRHFGRLQEPEREKNPIVGAWGQSQALGRGWVQGMFDTPTPYNTNTTHLLGMRGGHLAQHLTNQIVPTPAPTEHTCRQIGTTRTIHVGWDQLG